jgi:hypothetical protein
MEGVIAPMILAHGGGAGTASTVTELAPLPAALIFLVAAVGLLLFGRWIAVLRQQPPADQDQSAAPSALGLVDRVMASVVLFAVPVLLFDQVAYRERTVPAPPVPKESPVPTEVNEVAGARISFKKATDGGDVHLQANSRSNHALSLVCEIVALDTAGNPSTAESPVIRGPVLLKPGGERLFHLFLDLDRPAASMSAECEATKPGRG